VTVSLPPPSARSAIRKRAIGLVEGKDVVASAPEDLDQARGHCGRACDDQNGAAVHQEIAGRVAAHGGRERKPILSVQRAKICVRRVGLPGP
jgi:hypothetical protein